MNKYSCTTSTVGSIHFVTLVAENEEQAKEMAAAAAKVGQPRGWSARVLESGVEGPAQIIANGSREA
ncbi:MAG: hypothetical protein AB7H90_16220 [Alphaproteobacteria bacterium]